MVAKKLICAVVAPCVLHATAEFNGTVGPRSNPDDQYRFFWQMASGPYYQEVVDAGFNMLMTGYDSAYSRLSPAEREKKNAEHRRFVERMQQDGIDHVERLSHAGAGYNIKRFAQTFKDGTKNFRSMDFHLPACRAEMENIAEYIADSITNLSAVVGVHTSSEVRDGSRPSFSPEYAAACRRDLGFDPPSEYTGHTAGGAAIRADFPVSCVVSPEYKPLKYYVWYWKKGDGWNEYQDFVIDIFRRKLGNHLFAFYDPIVRTPPLWGSGGTKCNVGSQWYYPTPEPYGMSYVVSMENAMARGTPGMHVMAMIQGIAYRDDLAPTGRKVANEPAWVAERPNAKFITQPPDILREALWTLLSRRLDGIGMYAWNVLFDDSILGSPEEIKKKRMGTRYQFTNPDTFKALREVYLAAAVPLGPLLRAVPERRPEVAVLESYASHLLNLGGSDMGWGSNSGDLAVAANLQPYVIYEEEIARDGIPPSVKVLLAPNCGALMRTTFDAVVEFQKNGGVVVSDARFVPGILPDIAMPDCLLSRWERAHDAQRDRKMMRKGVKRLRGDLAWAYEPYGDSENPDIVVHVRTYREADYVFAINDKRTFGDYVGQWGKLEEKGLPNAGTVTVRRIAGAVYDLVEHKAVPFKNRNGKVEISVSYTTTDGRILLVAPRPLAPLSISVAADGEVEVHSVDKDVMIPIEVSCDGEKPRYGVVEDGTWKRPYKAGANLRVRNLADGRVFSPRLEASVSKTVYVDEFDLSHSSCGFGKKTQAKRTVNGNVFSVRGKAFVRGFGSHPEGAVAFRSNGKVLAFDACVALDDESTNSIPCRTAKGMGSDYDPEVVFKVWADGRIVWSSMEIRPGMKPADVHVNLAGAREIILETCSGRPWHDFVAANADWLDARFTCDAGATLEIADDPELFAQLGVLTPPQAKEPRINGADIWGVRPGKPIVFRVSTSGERPMNFSAKGLPQGVTLDARGVLRGVAPTAKGDYDIEVTAENAHGKATRTIRLAVGDTIALTPPMGWNSWNTLCYRLTADKVKAAAKAMDESGLANHGWAYVNLDDWWQMNNSGCPRGEMRKRDFGGRDDVTGPARDEKGKIIPNRSFPDMKGLADYIHSLGLKAGLYSSPGPRTCGECEGSLGHELQDAESWAEWGFDYVKYDWCSYQSIFKKETGYEAWDDERAYDDMSVRESYIKPYRLMWECLKKQNRDILYSFCQYGMAHTEQWARETGANCWRSWDDLKDTWPWMEIAIESRIRGEYHKYAGPGCWVDPDMMIVGQQLSFSFDHPSFLTPNEQYTHVSLWAMIGSPLLIGCDLTKMDSFTKNLLMNDEVIAVSQDRLGKVARRVRHIDAESVWVRPLTGGFTAVALVNRSPVAREMKVSFKELGVESRCWVKDLWRQKCEGKHAFDFTAVVPPHGTKLVKMRPVDCHKCS